MTEADLNIPDADGGAGDPLIAAGYQHDLMPPALLVPSGTAGIGSASRWPRSWSRASCPNALFLHAASVLDRAQLPPNAGLGASTVVGPSTIWLGGGNDVLIGGAGDDVIIGREGHDVLVGGFGKDGRPAMPRTFWSRAALPMGTT